MKTLKTLAKTNTTAREDFRARLCQIGEASRLTGVPVQRIRWWEKGQLLLPARSDGGNRLYSPEALARIRWLKAMRDKVAELLMSRDRDVVYAVSVSDAGDRLRVTFEDGKVADFDAVALRRAAEPALRKPLDEWKA